MKKTKSRKLHKKAVCLMPAGVNSPVRAFGAVGGEPVLIARAKGAHLWDVDGNRYLDYMGSWGPMILGHAHPAVVKAVKTAVERGTSYGASTEAEIELAGTIRKAIPSMEMLRLVSSGTEAVMSALRLARGYTGRDLILKFNGCYHGHADSMLVKAGSGAATFGISGSAGVPADVAGKTLIAEYNDFDAVRTIFARHDDKIAAVIVEPVAGNMGVVFPASGFLEGLRKLCDSSGALLIFDEVITGFRLRYGGYQDIISVRPDLTTLGKIIGGGLPVGAYGGSKEIMQQVAPLGPVYQAGTLSGNPLAVAAGLAALRQLAKKGVYEKLEKKTRRLISGIRGAGLKAELPLRINQVGSMFTVFFADSEVMDFPSAARADMDVFSAYFQGMLAKGIYLPPSGYEANFVSLAHSEADIDKTVGTVAKVLDSI